MTPGIPIGRGGSNRWSVGELLRGTVKVFQRCWPHQLVATVALMAVALLMWLIVGAIGNAIIEAQRPTSFNDFSDFESAVQTQNTVTVVIVVVSILIASIVSGPWIGAIAASVELVVAGQRLSMVGIWQRIRPRIGALVGYMLVIGIISMIPSMLSFAFVQVPPAAAFFLFVLLMVGLVVVFIFLDLAPFVIVTEGVGVGAGIKRSIALAKPAFWRLVGVHLVWIGIVLPLLTVILIAYVIHPVLAVLVFAAVLCVLAPAFLTYVGLIYADLRAAEYGRRLELVLPQPVILPGDAAAALGSGQRPPN